MSTYYIGRTPDGRVVSRKSTRNDFTHAAIIALGGRSARLPSFGTSAEGARRNFYTNHMNTADCIVVAVEIVDAKTFREATKGARG